MALSTRARRTAVGALLIAAVAVAAPALAGPNKSFSVTVIDGAALAGKTSTFTLRFNAPAKQQLGSAKVTAPTGFEIESYTVPPGTVPSDDGGTLTLSNLAIAPDTFKDVTVTATVSCENFTDEWSVHAKQANEFNGSPGNDLQPNPFTFVTDVAGQCVPCPEDASAEEVCFADQPLTGAAFKLRALPNAGNDAGDLTLGAKTGLELTCPNHNPVAGTVLFDFSGDREKVARLVVAKKSLPAGGVNGLKFCFGAPLEFAAPGSTKQVATFDWDGDGVEEDVWVKLLPDCANAADTRCVTDRGKVGQDGFIEARLPAGDPGMRG